MCGAQIRQSDRPKCVILIFRPSSSLNAALKWRLWCCRYRQSEASSEEKRNTCTEQRRHTYHCRSQIVPENLGSRMETPIIDTDGEEETGTFRMRTGHWVAAAWTWNWRLLSPLSCSVKSFRSHTLCIVGKMFPIYKITKQIAGLPKNQNKQKTSVRIHAIACQLVRNKTERPFRFYFFEWHLLFKIRRKEWKYPSKLSLADDDDHRCFTDTSNLMLTMQWKAMLTLHCNKQRDHVSSLSKAD